MQKLFFILNQGSSIRKENKIFIIHAFLNRFYVSICVIFQAYISGLSYILYMYNF